MWGQTRGFGVSDSKSIAATYSIVAALRCRCQGAPHAQHGAVVMAVSRVRAVRGCRPWAFVGAPLGAVVQKRALYRGRRRGVPRVTEGRARRPAIPTKKGAPDTACGRSVSAGACRAGVHTHHASGSSQSCAPSAPALLSSNVPGLCYAVFTLRASLFLHPGARETSCFLCDIDPCASKSLKNKGNVSLVRK